MAPEQVLGNRPLDGRTDVYAVGCLADWLVTGELVFSGPTAMETMMQHTYEVPVPPARRTELQVPEALDRLILECLEKNPDDRPATADMLAERLATIQPAAAWTQASARQWWDTHRPTANVGQVPESA
jgi:serine/threonine-protein kinase